MREKIFSDEIMQEARRAVSEHRMLPLCSDVVFKMFLTQDTDESRFCLCSILGSVIGRKVVSAEVLNPEILPDYLESKLVRLDVSAVLETGERANIEMQCGRNGDDQILRTVFYSGRLVSSSLKKGEAYARMKAVHQIMITDFTLFSDGARKYEFFHHWMLKDERNEVGTDCFNIYFIELTKLEEIVREKLATPEAARSLTELEFWCILLKYSGDRKITEMLHNAGQFGKEIKMAESTAYRISQEDRDWAYHLSYDRAEVDYRNGILLAVEKARDEGKAEGFDSGLEKGAQKKAEQNAINFLSMGVLSIEQIAQGTGLPLERVKELSCQVKSSI